MKLTTWFQVLREINLKRIERDAHAPFSLLLAGEPALTEPLARALGGGGDGAAIHPWIVRHPLPLPEDLTLTRPALALVVSPVIETDADHVEALRRLRKANVRTVTVVIGDATAMPEHAFLARANESARAIVPRLPDASVVAAALAPAVISLEDADAALALALARQLPPLRELYVARLVEDVARTNGGFTLSTGLVDLVPGMSIPLTAADIVVLTKNQIVMAYRIALAAGKSGDARTLVGEVIGVIGAGLLLRQVARELVGLIPAVGIVPKVVVAYAGTRLVGAVARAWALEGRTFEGGELRHLYEAALAGGRDLAAELSARIDASRERLPDHENGGGDAGIQ